MDIYSFAQQKITSYPSRVITLYGIRQFNQSELLNRIAAYTDSHYTTSQVDDLERRKPFYNITNRILHKQRTAEDIDTKDIFLSTKRPDHYAKSLLIQTANQAWMKRVNFAHTLNEMTEARGRDGGVLIRRSIRDGLLRVDVMDLLTTITDPVDIESGFKIQEMLMNPAEMVEMKANGWENVEDAIVMGLESNMASEDSNTKNSDYVKVHVVEGVLPRTMIDETAEEFEYSTQLHIVVLYATTDDTGEELQGGLTLFANEKEGSDFKYLPYEKASGRSLGRGMVEQSMEAQVSINEVVINEKNTMEIAGKVTFAQPSGNGLSSTNILTDYHDGAVFDYNISAPQLINATPASLGYNQTMIGSWQTQVNNQTSVQDVNTGNMPASTTFRGMALQNQEANSIFELRREEMGIFLKEVYQDWVIPWLTKWVSTQDFLEMEMTSEQMQTVLDDYSYNSARKIVDAKYFNGGYDDAPAGTKFIQMAFDTEIEADKIKRDITKNGRVWLKPEAKYLDGVEFQLDVVITDEQRIKQVYLSNQVDILNTYLANRDALQSDPNALRMYNQIQETLGLSPLQNFDQGVQGQQEVVTQASPLQLEAVNDTV